MRPSSRVLACAAVLAFAVSFAPRDARAADAKTQQELEQAEQGLVNLDYDTANKVATRLVATHGLTHDQLVRAYRVLALTDAVLDKEQQARDAFQALLTYDPSYQGDPNLGPKVQAPFMEARGFLRAQAVQPGMEASAVLTAGEGGTIRVMTRDPTHVVRRAIVGYRWGSDGPFTTVPIGMGEASTPVPEAPSGTTRLDYYVQALDANDSVVFQVGDPNAPKTSTIDMSRSAPTGGGGAPAEENHSIFASPWFWVITGVVVAGGATTAVLASHKSTTTETLPPTGTMLGPSLICGNGPTCR